MDYNNIKIKNNEYYNGRESLWNDPQKLDYNRFARYSEKNIDPLTTFKKSITNLKQIGDNEKQNNFDHQFK